MLVISCIKQVPDTTQVQIDPVTNTLIRDGIPFIMNPYDTHALEESLRRLGNEFAFDRMARENVPLFKARGVQKVITACPHSLTNLKNDYRQYGIELEVVHHSELIARLLAEGKITMNTQAKALGKIIVHDPAISAGTTIFTKRPVMFSPQSVERLPWNSAATGRTRSAEGPAAAACGWKSRPESASTAPASRRRWSRAPTPSASRAPSA